MSNTLTPKEGPRRETAIQWTDRTDNIIVAKGGGWWCRKTSPGCKNCYAEKLNDSAYFKGNHLAYSGSPPELELRRDIIEGWARQRIAKRHFVASMTDVFGEWVPGEWIWEMLDGMAAAPRQTFQVLTKRAARMATHVLVWLQMRGLARVPSNIWLGFSAEDQHWFDRRAKHAVNLRDVCDVLWVSAEPLLGPLVPCALLENNRTFIPDWLVLGGESGPDARMCDIHWIRSALRIGMADGVKCFVKQLGANRVAHWETTEIEEIRSFPIIRDKKGGDMAEWPEWLRVREFPGA